MRMPKLIAETQIFPPKDDARQGLPRITERKIEEDSGVMRSQYVWKRGAFVLVVPMESDGSLLIKKEFKYGQMKELLTFAAGGIEKNESPLEASKRELAEEFGVKAEKWDVLCTVSNSPDKSTEIHHLFLARNLEKITEPEAGTILRIPRSEVSSLLDGKGALHLEIALSRLALYESLRKIE